MDFSALVLASVHYHPPHAPDNPCHITCAHCILRHKCTAYTLNDASRLIKSACKECVKRLTNGLITCDTCMHEKDEHEFSVHADTNYRFTRCNACFRMKQEEWTKPLVVDFHTMNQHVDRLVPPIKHALHRAKAEGRPAIKFITGRGNANRHGVLYTMQNAFIDTITTSFIHYIPKTRVTDGVVTLFM